MFWPDDYLSRVARQIRVTRIRGPLIAELRDHMLLQKADYLSEGLSEAEAERRTSEDMGDALLVGGALDAAHRPKSQWRGLGLAALIMLLGLGLQFWCETLAGCAPLPVFGSPNLIGAAAAVAALALFAFTDYTLWVRWSLPACIVWLAMTAQRLWIWVAFDQGPLTGPGMRFLLSPLLLLAVPQVLAVAIPTVTALLACRLRGRGWNALALCMLPTLAIMLLSWLHRNSGYEPAACMLMAAISLVALALAVAQGFFKVRRAPAMAVLGLLAALALGFCAWRAVPDVAAQTGPDGPAELVRRLLAGSRIVGSGTTISQIDAVFPGFLDGYATHEYLFPAVVALCGWLPFAALLTGLAGLLAWCWRRFTRLENRMGGLLGQAATLTLAVQTALYLPASFGLISQQLCLPLLGNGSTMLVVDAALVGVMLGVLRGQSLPEAPLTQRHPKHAVMG